ncbi:relaxase/mobilization nuclease RlxS [Methyloceanibacter sp.]|uniref:relaxase/mobilization nuclease RlxS n=1 Tax=Methyloceanibacter sp. TaxID=1965321 RepID=UPI002C83EF56|nr:relaxase/mobilization nuclease RlxS [Methyloceanibacter sp.]HML92967.1 relaxase/mobilization nuclease RlxS [Methyloceanibacter sp.]
MTHDDDFEPRLGKIRSRGTKRSRKFLHQVLAAANLARGGGSGSRKSRFTGSRIGRGAGAGRVLASRDRYTAFRQRRVIVKARIVKLAGRGMDSARAHLRYIQRDGITREGEPGKLYDAVSDEADGKAFLERGEGDRHQFRFIVSAEDGAEYDDLKPFVRRVMARMEEDLGTRLDWVAVDHHNTGHPHTHILLRGKDEKGRDLIIAREYMSTGMRERAAEIVSLDFGPRSDLEIEERLRVEVEQERFTSIDRRLIRDMDEDGLVTATDRDTFQQSLRAGRLQKLKRLGLAEEVRHGHWRLSDDLEDTLRRMGERGDIIKTMHRELAEKGLTRSAADYVIYDPSELNAQPIIGRIVARGLSDEINDRRYLIVDGVDGRTHYVDIGKAEAAETALENAIVRIVSKSMEPHHVDRTVAEIASTHNGRYSIDIHLRHDLTATDAFAATHVRRLEAIRRATGGVTREADGTWIIGADHLDRVMDYERQQAKTTPVIVSTLSTIPLEQQVSSDGATWLDRELIADRAEPVRDSGFGREVHEAQARRRQWLIAEGLAHEGQDRIVYRPNMLAILRRRELTRVASQLSGELGLAYAEARPGERIEGTHRRSIELASGKYAVIEKSREFTLAPWRPVLDRHIGKLVSGIMRDDGISWTIGRQRAGPSVS